MLHIRGFDPGGLGKAVVVDLGGGNGHISVPIARAHPHLEAFVQVLETNAEPAKAAAPDERRNRVTFQTKNFFLPKATAYGFGPAVTNSLLVSRVQHDLPDRDCMKILKALILVLDNGKSKLFIVDQVLPDKPGEIFLYQEALMRSLALLMYNMVGGKERSLGEWETLFKEADGRWRIERVDTPVKIQTCACWRL
ncbi:uncharacterized protein A1O5_11846 [Cladophialophora psammophila CBS 110553]|uniref:O-methyltransferase C-terminal domain-containing protein n=1 Tax=Cladophialophora psammophila CBS 110553 TaxID=1182543 RepID=W9WSF7_9EURO|nr:uncharacterized protein A1O5_11846 [Cladophialophora psammophila CBS 110553]EXJ61289.1 hypothetical protein A1O5_11846 [Cladophialophora psammophila CBS 110553]